MALQTIGIPQVRRVTMLEDVTAEWVSFVDHGANWEPLRLIMQKRQGGPATVPVVIDRGDDMPGAMIQSILLPGSQELEELAANPQYAWLRDLVATTKKANLAHNRYVFAERTKFDQGSFRAVALGDTGAILTVGDLNEEAKAQGYQAKAAPADLVAAMADSQEDIIARLIGDETWRFEDILFASLRQNSATPKARKQTIMNALSAYWDFLNNILDVTPQTQIKIERPARETNTPVADNDNAGNSQAKQDNGTNANDTEGTDMTPEEISALVAKMVEDKLAGAKPEVKVETEPTPAKPDVVKGFTDMAAVITELAGTVKEIKADMANMKKADGDAGADPDPVVDSVSPPDEVMAAVNALKAQVESIAHAVQGTPPPADPRVQTTALKGEGPGSMTGVWSSLVRR